MHFYFFYKPISEQFFLHLIFHVYALIAVFSPSLIGVGSYRNYLEHGNGHVHPYMPTILKIAYPIHYCPVVGALFSQEEEDPAVVVGTFFPRRLSVYLKCS